MYANIQFSMQFGAMAVIYYMAQNYRGLIFETYEISLQTSEMDSDFSL